MQATNDRSKALEADLVATKKQAENVLATIRKVAEEQGVSQQSIYFKSEADMHANEAAIWLVRTTRLTVALVVYAVLALFLHKISILRPDSASESAQLAVGKVLIFVTIASYLVLSARNYMAHRHNAIVNRHRQHSLATYKALVEAAGDKANRDIVLTKAAESIFGPQATGFSKTEAVEGAAMSMINVGASLANGGKG